MADPKLNITKVGHLFARIEGLYNFSVIATGSIQAILKINRKAALDFMPGAMAGSSLFKIVEDRTISPEGREKFLVDFESQHSLHVTAVVLMFSFFEDFLESVNGSRNTNIDAKTFPSPAQLQSTFTWDEIVETNRMLCWLVKEVRNAWVHRDGIKGADWERREKEKFPNLAGSTKLVEGIYPGMGSVVEAVLRIPLTGKVSIGGPDLKFATNAKNILLDRAQLEAETYQLAQVSNSYELRPPFTP